MMEIISSNIIIGGAVVVLNLIPILTRKYKFLALTAILSLILMYGGTLL